MTSIVKLETLSGVRDDGPLCYLLQVDESYILLDCGWDESFDLTYIEAVKSRIPLISAVLLSYADTSHIGALPYLVAKCGLNAPVYATVPVFKMGQMFMYDWVYGHMNVEEFELFSLDDVDNAFKNVQQVKYNQTILLKGDNGIQFTPLPAGHMIGGAIWKISKQGDEEIVYAVDFNHKKERHLNGCTFDSISRPHLFITDAFNAQYNQPRRRDRDEELVTKMLTTVKNGGDCLIVIDTAGRVLEIAHLLDQLWSNSDAGLSHFNLVMLNHVASTVVDFARSQVEWMSDKILKSFETGQFNPFSFRNLQLCCSHVELTRVRSPKVVLCSGPDMESGFSRELFLEWSSDTRNTIIVTSRSGSKTLGSRLIKMATTNDSNRHIQLEIKKRIRLEGTELEMYRKMKIEREQEAARQRLEASRRNARLGMSQDDDEDSDDEEALANSVAAVTGIKQISLPFTSPSKVVNRRQSSQSLAPQTPAQVVPATTPFDNSHDILLKWEHQQKAAFFKQSKKSYPMYPYIEEKVKWDDYGEIIRPEEYMTADSIVPQTDGSNAEEKPLGQTEETAVAPAPTEDWPTKCVRYNQKVEVLCNIAFIDFEGRSDSQSVKKILAQIRPKQLIIVHGSNEDTRTLAQYAHDNDIVQGKIFTPRLGEIVDATVESHIFQVSLSDALMNQLFFQTVREADLSWIDAKIIRKNHLSLEEDNKDENMELDPNDENAEGRRLAQKRRQDSIYLDILPISGIPCHQAVFVNDPKLSDMKQMLMSQGYQAEFSSGVLHIDGIASIRKNEAGKFHVEGVASVQYYKIRDLIYKQFAII
ncbi:unnamed protein product [Auanema sp. JU1783]|nr:unnamed protein product [Auanema sp. JU1783]